MVKAVGNGKVIGQSDRTKIVDGNHLFPSEALRREFFQPSDAPTICPWKDIIISGGENISPLEVEDALLPGNVGLFCSTPAVAVARNIGWKRVMEMLLTGEPVDPRTAHA
jgi:hypothetical protein